MAQICGKMAKQYPHILYSVQIASDSARDDDGNWIEGSPSETELSICREVTDGKGKEIVSGDGTCHVYASIIFLPLSSPEVTEGTEVFVKDDAGKTRIKGKVLKFDKGQFHSRLWV